MGEISENDKKIALRVLEHIRSSCFSRNTASSDLLSATVLVAQELGKLNQLAANATWPRYDFPNPGRHTPHLPGDAFSDHEQMIKDRDLSTFKGEI